MEEAIKTAIGGIPFGEIKAAHIVGESSTHFEVEVTWIVRVAKAPNILEPRKKRIAKHQKPYKSRNPATE